MKAPTAAQRIRWFTNLRKWLNDDGFDTSKFGPEHVPLRPDLLEARWSLLRPEHCGRYLMVRRNRTDSDDYLLSTWDELGTDLKWWLAHHLDNGYQVSDIVDLDNLDRDLYYTLSAEVHG